MRNCYQCYECTRLQQQIKSCLAAADASHLAAPWRQQICQRAGPLAAIGIDSDRFYFNQERRQKARTPRSSSGPRPVQSAGTRRSALWPMAICPGSIRKGACFCLCYQPQLQFVGRGPQHSSHAPAHRLNRRWRASQGPSPTPSHQTQRQHHGVLRREPARGDLVRGRQGPPRHAGGPSQPAGVRQGARGREWGGRVLSSPKPAAAKVLRPARAAPLLRLRPRAWMRAAAGRWRCCASAQAR